MANSFDLKNLCILARLPEPDTEEGRRVLLEELERTISFFGEIAAIDTADIQPLFQPNLDETPLLRGDQVGETWDSATATANAADSDGKYFFVPRVLK